VTDTNSDVSIIGSLSAQEIMKLVQRLSPAYRTVFNLYVIEGYKHNEIAKMLDISVGSSKSNLAKAKANLRKMIAQDMPNFQYYSSR
jgi:RNA polymerase sigma-70 factor (ECF subfamily)